MKDQKKIKKKQRQMDKRLQYAYQSSKEVEKERRSFYFVSSYRPFAIYCFEQVQNEC